MHFGKYQGLVMAILGMALIALQILVHLKASPADAVSERSGATSTIESRTYPMVGGLGGLLAVAGGFVYFWASHKNKASVGNTVK